jgi:hypothetical protein
MKSAWERSKNNSTIEFFLAFKLHSGMIVKNPQFILLSHSSFHLICETAEMRILIDMQKSAIESWMIENQASTSFHLLHLADASINHINSMIYDLNPPSSSKEMMNNKIETNHITWKGVLWAIKLILVRNLWGCHNFGALCIYGSDHLGKVVENARLLCHKSSSLNL